MKDKGPGIPPENLDLIFDAFFTTKPTGSGTGLGLTIARKVIDLHEGIIQIDNRPDQTGTIVTIALLLDSMMVGNDMV
ncbi:HAMP domain-containing histidine kinase [bacterium]|nr:HAMP domain-containing histidine kinase [bacterium]